MTTKPHIVVCATPVYGHVMPMRAIAKALIQRGYEVTFVTGSDYKTQVESIGTTFIQLIDDADLTEEKVAYSFKGISKADPAGLHDARDSVHTRYFVNIIPWQYMGLQEAVTSVMTRRLQKVVVLVEGCFRGALLGMRGALDLKGVAGFIGVGIVPISLSSVDTAPFGPGHPPDASPEGQRRNAELHQTNQQITFKNSQQRFLDIFAQLGSKTIPDRFVHDAIYHKVDKFVQMCTPSFEYPRSDAPDTIVFAGGLPPGLRDPSMKFPRWWSEVTEKKGKCVVFVAQGTISMDPNDLIIPTLSALQHREDLIVVVALGRKGAKLEISIPDNARVEDFIPYDEMLEHADVFVNNAGYGAVQHGLGHGVPQVIAGMVADKAENAARVEWSGVGINLRTDKPTSSMIEKAVDEILGDPKYKLKAQELQEEMRTYDPIGVIIENITLVANI